MMFPQIWGQYDRRETWQVWLSEKCWNWRALYAQVIIKRTVIRGESQMCHGAERLEESPFVLVSETEGPARASFSCPEAASPANAVCLAQTSWFWISNLQMQRWDLYHFKMQQFYRRTTGSHAWLTLVIVSRTFPWLGNKFIYAVWIYIYQIWMCLCEYCVCFKPQNVFVSLFLGQAQNYWWLFISLCLHLYLFFS